MIKTKSVAWSDVDARKSIKAKLKNDGYRSAHYLTRHGWNVDKLRKLAKNNMLDAFALDTSGGITWYYKESDLARLAADKK